MRKKAEKIGVTIENASLFRSVVGDFAAHENRSLSAIIERTTLNALLPTDKYMRAVAQYQLFGEGGNVGFALATLFENNSASIDSNAQHTNFQPLVLFAREQSTFCSSRLLAGDKDAAKLAASHTASQLESLIDHLRGLGEKAEDEMKAAYYHREVKIGECYLKELKSEPEFFKTINGYTFVLDHWCDFSWSRVTYRFLNDLVLLDSHWRSDPEARLELLDLMKSVSKEWE